MSNNQNTTFFENYYELIEERQGLAEKAKRRGSKKSPMELLQDADNFIFGEITNLNK